MKLRKFKALPVEQSLSDFDDFLSQFRWLREIHIDVLNVLWQKGDQGLSRSDMIDLMGGKYEPREVTTACRRLRISYLVLFYAGKWYRGLNGEGVIKVVHALISRLSGAKDALMRRWFPERYYHKNSTNKRCCDEKRHSKSKELVLNIEINPTSPRNNKVDAYIDKPIGTKDRLLNSVKCILTSNIDKKNQFNAV